ncbi:hypothetical protein Q7P37_006102 [Cladosporium fusiforme]
MYKILHLTLLGLATCVFSVSAFCNPDIPEISLEAFLNIPDPRRDDWQDYRPYEAGHVLVLIHAKSAASCAEVSTALESAAIYLSSHNANISIKKLDCDQAPEGVCGARGNPKNPILREWSGVARPQDYSTSRAIAYRLAKLTNSLLPNHWSSERGRAPTAALWTKPSPDQPSANDAYLSADGSEAVVKLALPGFPLQSESQHEVLDSPSSAILHFKISPTGHHLMLNDRYIALTVRNPSIPPALEAAQIASEVRMDDLLNAHEQTGRLFVSPGRTLSLDYEFDMGNRDDPSIRYYRYHPDFQFNIIGAGSGFGFHTTNNFLLDDNSQKIVQIKMKERNGLHSWHPDRNYTILGVKFLTRPRDYNPPEPKDARICAFLSWRCADISDPPYYKRELGVFAAFCSVRGMSGLVRFARVEGFAASWAEK